jgi:hypothetical protein
MIARVIVRGAALCDRALRFGGGFFETKAPQSMVRACALLCGVAGAVCAIAAYDLAHRPHVVAEHVAMIAELTKLATVFIAGGVVALLARTRSTAVPPGGV